ncbi:MAG: class I SAM-dependent methyltransferase [Candidatus Omnitrophota bacterium]
MKSVNVSGLKDLCGRASTTGKTFDLSDCVYGETDGCCAFVNRPTAYYFFLAGLVRVERCSYILETGTHYGGSIMAMAKGLHADDVPVSTLVTVDITFKNEEGFKKYPRITRIRGDALSGTVRDDVSARFDRPIDLLYIDSLHEYDHTKKTIDAYARSLDPKYLILDDIHLSGPMEKLWAELAGSFGERSFDASELARRRSAGFGVIRWRDKDRDPKT